MILFNVLQNNDSFVIMSALDGLSDLAFDKGWRIFDAAIPFKRMQEYQNDYDMPFYTEANFYLDFLQDEVMPEEECTFLAGLCTCYYEDNDSLNVDNVDEEEINHEFHFMEAPLHEDTEFNQEI